MKIFNIRLFSALLSIQYIMLGITDAQIQVPGSGELLSRLRWNDGSKLSANAKYEQIKGSPYMFEDFRPAELVTKKNEVISLPLRYDIYANEMHVNNKGEIYAIVHPELLSVIHAGNIDFIYSGVTSSGKNDQSYFILQSDGKCKLLVKKEIRIQDAELPKLYQEAKPAEFIHLKDSYYFKIGTNDAVKVTSKGDVLMIMADKKAMISKFMKESKTSLNKIDDVQRLVEYYNSL